MAVFPQPSPFLPSPPEVFSKTEADTRYATAAQGTTADSAVQPASTDTLTNKTISTASNTVSAIAAGAVVSRTLQDHFSDIVSVFDFGAVGDGSTDDTSAIEAAIALVATSGGTVYFPPGTFKITSNIVVTANNVSLVGAGRNATIIAPNFASGNYISFGSNVSVTTTNKISDLAIVPTVTQTSGALLAIVGAAQTIVRDVWLSGGYDGVNIISYNNQSGFHIFDSIIVSCTNSGVSLGVGSSYLVNEIFLSNLTISNCANGIIHDYVDGLYGNNVSIYQGTTSAKFTPSDGKTTSHIFYCNSVFDSASQGALTFFISGTGDIGDLNFSSCALNSNASGLNIDASCVSHLSGLKFTDCYFENNTQRGVYVGGGTNITFANCLIGYNSTSGSASYPGVEIAANIGYFKFLNCTLGSGGLFETSGTTNNQSYGVLINTGSSDNYSIINCKVSGNVTGGISDSGSGTNKNRIANSDGVTVIGGVTYSFPTSADTLVGRASTDTLENKTLSSPQVTGAITGAGLWQAGIVSGTYGGTGVNNGSRTITLAGSLTLSGAYATTITVSAETNATIPAGTHTLAGLDVAQSWSANQTFTGRILTVNGSAAAPEIAPGSSTTSGLYFSGTGTGISSGGVSKFDYGITTAGVFTFADQVDFSAAIKLKTYTVATLPTPAQGMTVFASDLRVFDGLGTLEGAGAGTGGAVTYNGSAWKIAGTNVTASA